VLALPNQKRGVLARHGITREEADRAAWAIGPDGVWSEGAAAVNRVLREMGGGWPALARAYRLWPVAAVEESAYRWFARNRSRFQRFGVSPECDEPGSDCE
jgi:predicted DCC family thiol-disulfide oxidoreductase YuxK